MRELDPIEVTTTQLEPGCSQKLIIGQPYPDPVLLSHFEGAELSPRDSSAELTDLRIEKLCHLIKPMPLALLQREQRYMKERFARQTRQGLEQLLGPQITQPLLQHFKPPSRRETQLIKLDIRWKPHQTLFVTFKNAGLSTVNKVSIELILYGTEKLPPAAN